MCTEVKLSILSIKSQQVLGLGPNTENTRQMKMTDASQCNIEFVHTDIGNDIWKMQSVDGHHVDLACFIGSYWLLGIASTS